MIIRKGYIFNKKSNFLNCIEKEVISLLTSNRYKNVNITSYLTDLFEKELETLLSCSRIFNKELQAVKENPNSCKVIFVKIKATTFNTFGNFSEILLDETEGDRDFFLDVACY